MWPHVNSYCSLGSLNLPAVANEALFKHKRHPVNIGPDTFVGADLNVLEFCITAEDMLVLSYLKLDMGN